MLNRLLMKYRKQSVYGKINLLHNMIIIIVILFIMAFVSRIASNMLMQEKISNSSKDIVILSEKIDMLLEQIENTALSIISNSEFQNYLIKEKESKNTILYSLEFNHVLSGLYLPIENIENLYFYDVIHESVYGSSCEIEGSWKKVMKFIEKKERCQWNSFEVVDGKESSISFMHRVNNYNGKFMGVLELVLDEKYINRMYANLETEDFTFFILEDQKRIVSATDKSCLGTLFAEKSKGRQKFFSDSTGDFFYEENGNYLVIGRQYQDSQYLLLGMLNKTSVIESTYLLIKGILLIGAVGILIAFFLVKWSLKRTMMPLKKVMMVIKEINAGNYSARVQEYTLDELGELGRKLDEMMDNTVHLMKLIEYQSEQKRKYELENLQMQINPHFLYNSLETVCGIIEAGENQLAIRMVTYISRFYRSVLCGGETLITIDQEVQIALRYMEIIKIRYGNSFEFDYDIPGSIIHAKIPKLTLQPIIENAIMHGFLGAQRVGKIRIRGRRRKNKIILFVIDNGRGISQKQLGKVLDRHSEKTYQEGGFGLYSIGERIQLSFGEGYGLKIQSKENRGTCIQILLPDLTENVEEQ